MSDEATSDDVTALLLAQGHATDALPVLRAACRHWQELHAPHDCARVRVLLAAACRALGDADGTELELTAAAAYAHRHGLTGRAVGETTHPAAGEAARSAR
ncbi:hypothetical protein [Pseudonocardia asaccharolytica]|uniref:Bacterial transcriptional activator domain-containing protein n=1 Tax=Pseudonocardia asaccharolytica DSM 44247 = NBRC 16224 TaxID=1123024 RepID=A0A511CYJ4_9PSEU|nr:hypothetical protein [Pseudonocardia asaccharolytica]GEL17630.1 hypothetical protein PA7_14670 [Pseudonocardia asaccharolytica DSM 44247 = NBRC 16224]